MTRNKLNGAYFDWLCRMVCGNRRIYHNDILSLLHDREFTYTLSMDGNRFEDGVNLRYRFGSECRHDDRIIASYLDDRPCSVLEMMVALAIRCEDQIMDDPDIGNRTGQWFWTMMESLGLDRMTDSRFNERRANKIIDIFLNREYEPNGKGGLFTVNRSRRDLRSVEIWYQMCGYLDEVL